MRVSVRGIELYFDVVGAGHDVVGGRLIPRPTILALHGGPGFDHAYLRPGLAPLSDWAQVVFLDLRGQGRSQPVAADTCTFDAMADDAAAFCDAIGLDKPLVVGHSAGGQVALKLALNHPGRLGGLVLLNAAARLDFATSFATLERSHGADARAAAEQVFAGDLGPQALERYMRLVAPAYAHPETAHALADLALSGLNADIAAHVFVHDLPGYDERHRLGELALPVLAVSGADDWLTPIALVDETVGRIRHAAAAILPDTGHLACNERPQQVDRLIRDHWTRCQI